MIGCGEDLFRVDSVISEPVVQVHVDQEAELRHPILRQAGDAVAGLRRAQRCLEFAESWRNFRVASCAITFLDDDNTVSIIHGVNRKPDPNGGIDIHAEGAVLEEALRIAREPLSVIALVADVQPDQTAQLDLPTLTPCLRRCLPELEASELVVPSTLALSANPDLTCVQYYDVPTLRRAYEEMDPDLLPTVYFESPDGEDHAEWHEKLQQPIAVRAHDLITQFMQSYLK